MTTQTTLTTWTQANAIIRRHFELQERLPTFPAEAADELTDKLAPIVDALLAEQRERIAQAIEAKYAIAKAAHYRSALTVAARIARETP